MGFYQTRPGLIEEGDASRIGVQSRSLPMGDSSFHIRTAYLYRTGDIAAAGTDFHWLRPTFWGDHFVDKEFLYHIYLVPFTLGARDLNDTGPLIWGAKFATSLLFAMLALTLWAVLRALGVRHAWAFTALMFVLGGPLFCGRTHETRSWPAGLIIALTAWLAMAKGRRLDIFFLAALYTLTYAAVHFLAMLWFVRAAVALIHGPARGSTRLGELKQHAILLVVLMAGIGMGVLLHPGRGDFIQTWVVQYVLVPFGAVQGPLQPVVEWLRESLNLAPGASVEQISMMMLGNELAPVPGALVLAWLGPVFCAAIGLPLASAMLRHRPSRELVTAGAMALVTMVMCVSSMRFSEIMGPFAALATGLWINELLQARRVVRFARKRPMLSWRLGRSALAACAASGAGLMLFIILNTEVPLPRPWRDAALWLRDNEQAQGKLVYNQSWDMFSELIFYAPTSDYVSGMDPYFLLAADADKSRLFWDNYHGRVGEDTLDKIMKSFNPDYLLIAPHLHPALEAHFRKQVERGRLRIAFDDTNYKITLYEVVR